MNRKKVVEFLKYKPVLLLIFFIIISAISIASIGIDEGLDLKGGSMIQLELESPVNSSTMDTVTAVLDKRLNLYGVSDVKVRESGDQRVIIEMAGKTPEEIEHLIGNPGIFEAKIDNQTAITGSDVESVDNYKIEGETNWVVPFSLTADGAKKFAEVAQGKGGHEVVMYLDGHQITNDPPKLENSLGNGEAVTDLEVTGSEDTVQAAESQASMVYTVLKTGSLPVKVHVIGSNTISAELGQEFLEGVGVASLLAILVISIIIFLRYKKPLLVIPILITSLSEILIVLGIASIISWNIDLAAIAGLIASVGTGVDDQIIITDEVLSNKSNKSKNKRARTRRNVRNALFIIFASAGTLIAAMLPLTYVGFVRGSSGIGTIAGFAFTTILGVLIGVFITRPAYAKFVETFIS